MRVRTDGSVDVPGGPVGTTRVRRAAAPRANMRSCLLLVPGARPPHPVRSAGWASRARPSCVRRRTTGGR
ncbi:unannotated protein [freshwater metagenome]|uniref:Unannotated protein n=1 Tax=freshwater metagenome TaxID=449393 RepID=A0A6J7HWA2_9ZZZZ